VRQSMAVFLPLHLSSKAVHIREILRQSDGRRRANKLRRVLAMCLLQFIRRPFRALESRSAGQKRWGLVGSVDRDVESLQGKREQSSGRMISGLLLLLTSCPSSPSARHLLLARVFCWVCLGRGNVPARRETTTSDTTTVSRDHARSF